LDSFQRAGDSFLQTVAGVHGVNQTWQSVRASVVGLMQKPFSTHIHD
jgi:hypothetical protein